MDRDGQSNNWTMGGVPEMSRPFGSKSQIKRIGKIGHFIKINKS